MESPITNPITVDTLANIASAATIDAIGAVVIGFIPRIIVAILFLAAFWLFYRLTRSPIERLFALRDFDAALTNLLVRNIYKYTLYIFGFILALGQLGIDVTAAIAGVGVAGLAIGFAAKDTIANVFAGVTVFWDKPFAVGDLVEIEGKMGLVKEITLRSTRVRTGQNQYIVIPNQTIANATIINHSKRGPVRVDIPIGIAYKENVQQAREALLAMLEGDKRILREGDHPETKNPDVIVDALGDSSVSLKLRFWAPDALAQFALRFNYTEKAKSVLDAANIEIPFPQRQLQITEDVARRLRGSLE